MAAVRLRGVEWVRGVTDVLSAVKHSEGQTRQKIPRREIASHWADLEASLGPQVAVDVLQLGDVVLSVVTELGQL